MSITSRTRTAAWASACAIAAVALAGCATGGTSSGNPPANATSPDAATSSEPGASGAAGTESSAPAELSGEITVWSWDVAAEGMKRLAPEFEKAHPGTTIDVVDIGYDNAYDKISVGLQANAGLPDVITVETDHMPGYIAAFPNGFTDLAPAVGDQKADFDPSKKLYLDGFAPGQNFKAKTSAEVAGDIKQASQEAPEAIERQHIRSKVKADMLRDYYQNLAGQGEKK